MTDIHNPMGTDGFEFIEYTAPDPELLRNLFEKMGFPATAKHRSKNVTLHSQGDINFIINAEPGSFARRFAEQHGPSICAVAFRVNDAARAYARALDLGAQGVETRPGPMELNIPAMEGIGGSRIYLVDRYGDRTIYDVDFVPVDADSSCHAYRADLCRPPDPQRPARQYGQMGRVLRETVQLPRIEVLRYRGETDRAEEPGHDQPLRQNTHPDQRVRR